MAAARGKAGIDGEVSRTAGAKVVPIRRGLAGASGEPSEAAARDRQLARAIAGIAGGDERALEGLYAQTVARVYGIALRIVRVREAAEEVAEDVFVQVWRTAASYDPARGGPLAWILTIARSRALDYLRRDDRAEAHPEPELLHRHEDLRGAGDPQDILVACENHRELARALGGLSAIQRQLIALAFFRGLTHQEIADHAGLPLGTVKTCIRRGLAAMREALATPS